MKEGKCWNCKRVMMIAARGLCGTCYPHWTDLDRLDRLRRKYAAAPPAVIDCQVAPKREEAPHLLGELVEISRSCSAMAREAIRLAIELYGKEATTRGLREVDSKRGRGSAGDTVEAL